MNPARNPLKSPCNRSAAFQVAIRVAAALAVQSASAANTWDGGAGTGNWNDPANWDNDLVPSGTPALAFAGTTQLGTANNTVLAQVGSLDFNTGAGAFTLAGTGLSLNGNISNNSANLQSISLPLGLSIPNITVTGAAAGASVTLGSITNNGGSRTLTNSLAAGNTLAIGAGFISVTTAARTLTLNGSGTTTVTGIIANGGTGNGTLTYSGTGILDLQGANTYGVSNFVSGTVSITGANATTGTTTVGGSAAATLNISGPNAATGIMAVNGLATLNLDYGTFDNSKLADAAVLSLAGGTVILTGGTHCDSVSGLSLGGASSISRASGSAGLSVAGITRSSGSTLALGEGGVVATTTGAANSLLTASGGAYAVVGGNDWAAKDALNSKIVGFSTVGSYSNSTASSVTNASQTEVAGNVTLAGDRSTSTLRFKQNAATTIAAAGFNLTLTQGGILVTSSVGANTTSIGGGTLKPGVNNELIVFQNNPAGELAISAVVANGSGTSAVTKSGAGTLVFSGANTYTGATRVNAGSLVVNGSLAGGGAVTVAVAGTLGGGGTVAGTVNAAGSIAPGSGAGAGTLTTGAAILSGTLAVQIDGAAGDKLLSTGTLEITGANLTVSLLAGGFSQSSYVIAQGSSLVGTFAGVPSGYNVTYTASQAILSRTGGNYATWENSNGIPGQSAAGDFDGDGISNLTEYALGLDPAAPDGSAGAFSGGILSFTKGADAVANGDVTYALEESTTLGDVSDPWAVVTPTVNNPTTLSFTLPTGMPMEFVRLKITRVP